MSELVDGDEVVFKQAECAITVVRLLRSTLQADNPPKPCVAIPMPIGVQHATVFPLTRLS